MNTVVSFDDGDEREGDSEPETCDAADHRKEEEIMEGGRYDTHDSDTLPDLASPPPWAYEDVDRQAKREGKTLLAACQLGLARVHLAVWTTIAHGDRGANGAIRYAAWVGRGCETTPRPVDEDGLTMRRSDDGVASYRDMVAQYGIARCTIERAYEHFVDAVLPYARNGSYSRIVCVLRKHMANDLGAAPQPIAQCDWLEKTWWSLGDLNETLIRRCPTSRIGRDPVRAMAYQLLHSSSIASSLAKSFRMPSYQTARTLADEFASVETVVGRAPLARIMAMLADSIA